MHRPYGYSPRGYICPSQHDWHPARRTNVLGAWWLGKTLDIAGAAGNRVITGVEAGTVSATSSQAINGAQLYASNQDRVAADQAIAASLGGGATYNGETQTFVRPTYKVGNSSYDNVGDAVTSLSNADNALNDRVNQVANQVSQFNTTTNLRIDKVERQANAGIASAMAMESAPFVPGKFTYALGTAYHAGESALGAVLRKTSNDGRWSLTGGVAAATEGKASVRFGVSGVID